MRMASATDSGGIATYFTARLSAAESAMSRTSIIASLNDEARYFSSGTCHEDWPHV